VDDEYEKKSFFSAEEARSPFVLIQDRRANACFAYRTASFAVKRYLASVMLLSLPNTR
jgi:hypothetical protein